MCVFPVVYHLAKRLPEYVPREWLFHGCLRTLQIDSYHHHLSLHVLQMARDEIQGLDEYHCVGWLRVDLQPIKQVLTTYASKWMWTFTKYLSDQVTLLLHCSVDVVFVVVGVSGADHVSQ